MRWGAQLTVDDSSSGHQVRRCFELLRQHVGECRIVEQGPTQAIFDDPRDDYTRLLLASSPELAGETAAKEQGA